MTGRDGDAFSLPASFKLEPSDVAAPTEQLALFDGDRDGEAFFLPASFKLEPSDVAASTEQLALAEDDELFLGIISGNRVKPAANADEGLANWAGESGTEAGRESASAGTDLAGTAIPRCS